jgi:hypothetical protein
MSSAASDRMNANEVGRDGALKFEGHCSIIKCSSRDLTMLRSVSRRMGLTEKA